MKITTVLLSAALFCFLVASLSSYAAAEEYPLHVEYAGGTAEPYIVMTDPGVKYTITQPYSWVRDETSRYSLISYSVNDGDYIDLSRRARGDFTLDLQMDSPHSVRFLAVIQYPISVGGNGDLTINFSPPSPTHDNWFDLNSEVTISVPYTTAESTGTRQQLESWSFDRAAANNIVMSDDDGSDSFATNLIMSRPHSIEFSAQTQHYVNIMSEYGTPTPSGWHDAGTTTTISIIPPMEEFLVHHDFAGWEGAAIASSEGYSASIIVDSPKTLVAEWTVDYTQLMIVIIGIAAGATAAVTLAKIKGKWSSSAKITDNSATAYEQHDTELQQNSATTVVAELQQTEKHTNNSDGNSYQNQIMEYALQKSIEMLETFRTSAMISEAKFSRIKEELEQSFH